MNTLPAALRAHVEVRGDQVAIHLLRARQPDLPITYARLAELAAGAASRYEAHGLGRGAVIAIILEHGEPLLAAFWGAVLCGATPAILPFLTEKLSPEKYRQDLVALIGVTRPAAIVTYTAFLPEAEKALAEAAGQGITELPRLLTLDAVEPAMPHWRTDIEAEDIALLQHSSGSTGLQKGVALSHRAVFNQLHAYAAAIRLDPATDCIASWLPLYHDMGLIASFVLPITLGIPLVLLSPFDWVRAPARLLQAMATHHATLCWLPNFAYNFMATRVRERDVDGVDLSAMRAFVNCSEPMRAASHRLFVERFAGLGVRAAMMTTCYAMAENVFAVTQGGMTGPVAIDRPLARALREDRHAALPPPGNDAETLEMLSAGRPIHGVDVRIVDGDGTSLAERRVGEIALRSNCMLSGYYHRPDATAQAFRDGWYLTGDFGYLADGELYVTGRKKDLIIVGGKNVYPQDLELLAEEVPGVLAGRVVAFGLFDEASGTEEVALIAETELSESEAREALREGLRRQIASRSDVVARVIALAPPRWLVKTSSGKVARTANREKYLSQPPERVA